MGIYVIDLLIFRMLAVRYPNNNATQRNEMEVIDSNGLCLSRHGGARQLMIFAHGDFKSPYCCGLLSGDGQTQLPPGVSTASLYFYTSHATSEVGFSVLQEIMLFPALAFDGLNCRDAVELKEGDNMGPQNLPSNMKVIDKKVVGESIRNYAIYHHDSAPEKLDKHKAEENIKVDGTKNTDVDLLIVTAKSRKHLSDVFNLCSQYGYERYHFAACRVKR
jgi:filamentous hemagglutinin